MISYIKINYSSILGIISLQILTRFGEMIPYTVIMFGFGILFSAISRVASNTQFGLGIESWISLDAELIVFIFLPPLIFGEAMRLNWHHAQGYKL